MLRNACILAMVAALAAPLASAQVASKDINAGTPEVRNAARPTPPHQRVMPCGEVGHGVIRQIGAAVDFGGEEIKCWQLVREDGVEFELVVNENQKIFDGVNATIFGRATDVRTKCYAGAPTEACAIIYDDMRESVGAVAFEETCWTLTTGGMKYAIVNPADLVDVDGLDARLGETPARAQIKFIETHQAPTKEMCYLLPIYVLEGRAF